MRRALAVLALFAMIGGGFYLVPHSQKSVPHNQSQPTKSEAKNPGTQKSLGKQEQHYEAHGEGNWYKTFLDHTPDWFVALFTALLFFVTNRLVKSTNKLWDAGERQIKLTRSVAAVQARNTRRQLRLSEDTAERELRAYLWVEVQNILQLDEANPIAVRVAMNNAGKTPAYNVCISCSAIVAPALLPSGTQFNADFSGSITVTTIHPGSDRKFAIARSSAPPSLAMVDQINNGSHRLYVGGVVSYEDAFAIKRTTKFLVSAGGNQFRKAFADAAYLQRKLPEGADIDWEHSNLHNEAN